MIKKLLILIMLLSFTGVCFAAPYKRVGGYYKKNGTYVKSYVRTNPDYSKTNNFNTKGNYNPYSGKRGYGKLK